MKFFTGCVAAAKLALAVTAAHAQGPSGVAGGSYVAVSDIDGPYAPPAAPPTQRYGYGYGYEERGPAPVLLPSTEVYAVLRDKGYSPLGIPRLRGAVYSISAIDRHGDDGRLIIDARDGRIIRFMPAADAYGMAPSYPEPAIAPYGPQTALPPPTMVRGGPPRPPASIPHVASRAVPMPKPAPQRAEAPTAKPSEQSQARPAQQAAVVEAKPAGAVPQTAASTVGQAKPAATILPTQEMPAAQGLD